MMLYFTFVLAVALHFQSVYQLLLLLLYLPVRIMRHNLIRLGLKLRVRSFVRPAAPTHDRQQSCPFSGNGDIILGTYVAVQQQAIYIF